MGRGRALVPPFMQGENGASALEGNVRPKREVFRKGGKTYFVSFQTARRQPFFRHDRWGLFFLNTLGHYRKDVQLHAFVVMPDHVHLLMSPAEAWERAVQLIKGGFSFAATREFQWTGDIWQAGFTAQRIRGLADLEQHVRYIRKNFESLGEGEYRFCGAHAGLVLDAVPQWLKPHEVPALDGGAEAPPLHAEAPVPHAEAPSHHAKALPPHAEISLPHPYRPVLHAEGKN